MNQVSTPSSPANPADQVAQLRKIARLAPLLQHLETTSYRGHAEQYRHVVTQLSLLLRDVERDETLFRILKACPSAAEIYENLRYAQSGLCLQDLERSAASEVAVRKAIDSIRQ